MVLPAVSDQRKKSASFTWPMDLMGTEALAKPAFAVFLEVDFGQCTGDSDLQGIGRKPLDVVRHAHPYIRWILDAARKFKRRNYQFKLWEHPRDDGNRQPDPQSQPSP